MARPGAPLQSAEGRFRRSRGRRSAMSAPAFAGGLLSNAVRKEFEKLSNCRSERQFDRYRPPEIGVGNHSRKMQP